MPKEKQYPSFKTKIDALNEEAWNERVSNSTNALNLSKSAVLLADEINYKEGLANGLRTLGFAHIRISKHQEALNYLQQSLALFEELNDLPGQSDVYEYLGIIQRSFGNYEDSLNHLFTSLELRQKTGYREGESLSLYHLGVSYKYLGDYNQALDYFLKSLSIANEEKYWVSQSYCLNNIGLIYFENEDYKNALDYFNQSLSLRRNAGDKWGEAGCLDNMGACYFKTTELATSIEYYTKSLDLAKAVNDSKGEGNVLIHLGAIYKHLNDPGTALKHFRQSLSIRKKIGDKKGEAEANVSIAELYTDTNFNDIELTEAISLLNEALAIGNDIKSNELLAKIHYGFYELNKKEKAFDNALAHLEAYYKIEKEIHKSVLNQKILNLEISHRVENARQEAEIYKLRNIELVGLYEELKKQTNNLEITLSELKSAQAQLIQSEKMASLGELTAGIAHEIQNPLNFVNNFSEVSNELLNEMKTELAIGNKQEAIILADDVKQNLEKILHHGKRADAIVKGMLQHSRSSTGVKEPTDINALCDEYLRLSYHGLRAKDKSFNATMTVDFDETIGKINIIPQDIGRVLLNIYNNAFYACAERSRSERELLALEPYVPRVTLVTKKLTDKPDSYRVEITITDNGNGIPQKIVDKIFQPFFTTKPTGQGTGLGLSLSYDIIKAHGGEIKVETKEGEGSEFIIQLPIV